MYRNLEIWIVFVLEEHSNSDQTNTVSINKLGKLRMIGVTKLPWVTVSVEMHILESCLL